MPVRVVCPSCATELNVRDEHAGRSVKCPKCGYVIPPAQGTPPPLPTPAVPPPVPPVAPPRAAPVQARPADSRRDDDEPRRPSRRSRNDDDDDDDDRPRPRRRAADDEDDGPPRKKGSSTGVVLGIFGGLLLVCCGGGAAAVYWFFIKAKEVVQEIEKKIETANFRVNRGTYDQLKINMTRVQADRMLGENARVVTPDELPTMFGPNSQGKIAEWRPRVEQRRVIAWRNGDDYLLVCFHPSSDAAGKVQAKAWEPKSGAAAADGSPDDQVYLDKFSKLDPNAASPEDQAKEARAQLQIHAILRACETYFINPNSDNEYPKTLRALVKPPFGGTSFLANEGDLTDPWGKPFKYEVATTKDGTERPFVWTERVVDGRTKVIGTKPPGR